MVNKSTIAFVEISKHIAKATRANASTNTLSKSLHEQNKMRFFFNN